MDWGEKDRIKMSELRIFKQMLLFCTKYKCKETELMLGIFFSESDVDSFLFIFIGLKLSQNQQWRKFLKHFKCLFQ